MSLIGNGGLPPLGLVPVLVLRRRGLGAEFEIYPAHWFARHCKLARLGVGLALRKSEGFRDRGRAIGILLLYNCVGHGVNVLAGQPAFFKIRTTATRLIYIRQIRQSNGRCWSAKEPTSGFQ
jgi:hypothetical protein